jgi:hypothetical protein
MVHQNEPEFDKDIELLKINLLSNRALAYSTTFTAIIFGMWVSINVVALTLTRDIASILFIVGVTAVIFLVVWVWMLVKIQGKNNIKVGQWLKKVQNKQSIGDWEKLVEE